MRAEIDGVTLEYALGESGGAILTRCESSCSSVILPAFIDGHPMEAIATDAFAWQRKVERVSFPDTLRRIEDFAFRHCALQGFDLPAGVEFVGDLAFASTEKNQLRGGLALEWGSVSEGNVRYCMHDDILCERLPGTQDLRAMFYAGPGGTVRVDSRIVELGPAFLIYRRDILELYLHDGLRAIAPSGLGVEKVIPRVVMSFSRPYSRCLVDVTQHAPEFSEGIFQVPTPLELSCNDPLEKVYPGFDMVQGSQSPSLGAGDVLVARFSDSVEGIQLFHYGFSSGMFTPELVMYSSDETALQERDDAIRYAWIVERLARPHFLRDEARQLYAQVLERRKRAAAMVFARGGDCAHLAMMADCGFLGAGDIVYVLESISASGDVEMKAFLLGLQEGRPCDDDFEL